MAASDENRGYDAAPSPVGNPLEPAVATAELRGHEYVHDHRCVRIIDGEVCYRGEDDPVHQKPDTAALCGAPMTAGPGAGIPTTCKREKPCPIHDNPALDEVRA